MLIDQNSNANRRMSLADQVRADIAEGGLPHGTQIRPIRSLAEQYGVSYATMRRVLLKLQEQGVVELQHGSGVYVAGGKPEAEPEKPRQAGTRRLLVVVPEWVVDRGQDVVQRITTELFLSAYRNHWHIEVLIPEGGDGQRPGFLDEVLWREPDGVAWVRPYVEHHSHLARLADRDISLCACGRRFPDMPYPTFSVDLASLAEQVIQWCAAHGRKRIAVLANLIIDSFLDDYAAEALHELEQAAQRNGLHIDSDDVYSLPIPCNPRTQEIFADFARKRSEVDTYICLFQHFFPVLSELAQEGIIASPSSLAVVDYCQHYLPAEGMPSDLSGMTYVRAHYDPALEGKAMARFFEHIWLDTVDAPDETVPVWLEEVPFPGPPFGANGPDGFTGSGVSA